MTHVLFALLLALSLCADCFAVSLCSSTTLGSVKAGRVAGISLTFAVIQSLFLFLGWCFGSIFLSAVISIANWIGFLLLLFIGGSMIMESMKMLESKPLDFDGFWHIVVGGVATSIDALAVGVSMSMAKASLPTIALNCAAVFVVTVLSTVLGIYGGRFLGRRFGNVAEILGGIGLILIGFDILLF